MKDYLKHYDNYYTFQEQWWGDKSLNWEGALQRAWMSRLPDGKMHSHQRRVSSKLGVGLRVSLADGLQPSLETFEQLYSGFHLDKPQLRMFHGTSVQGLMCEDVVHQFEKRCMTG